VTGAAAPASRKASPAGPAEFAAVDPPALHELELHVDARIEGDEEQAASAPVAIRVGRQERPSITDRAAQDSMTPDFVRSAGVARVRAAGMRAEGTPLAARIVGRVEEVVDHPLRVRAKAERTIGRYDERGPVRPAAHEFRCELELGMRVVGAVV
jgi:hypothetical protein